MKKLLAALLAVMSTSLLVACSSETEKMEGTYYNFGTSSNTGKTYIVDSPGYVIKISGDTMTVGNEQYSINEGDKTVTGSNGTLSYSYSDDVLTLDGDTYVKTGTDKYDKIYEKVHKNDDDD